MKIMHDPCTFRPSETETPLTICMAKPEAISLSQSRVDIGTVIGKSIEAHPEIGFEKPRSMLVPNKSLLRACSRTNSA